MDLARLLVDEYGSKYDVKFYIDYLADTRVVIELCALPTCHGSIYHPVGEFDALCKNFTLSTIRSLNTISPEDLNADTIMIVHTLTVFQLGGLAEWFSNLPAGRRPKLLLRFLFPLEFRILPGAGSAHAVAAAREAATALASAGCVRFASNSHSLAEIISRQIHQPFAVLPQPVRWPNVDQTGLPDPGVVFGFFGGLRPEKGASLLARAIPEFAARHRDARFIVQAPEAEADAAVVRALETVPQVELIRKNFRQKADYFANFCRAHCILLPYDPHEYAHRDSHILLEALGLGRLVITTKGTWLHAESLRYGITPFGMSDYTAEQLLSCMDAVHDRLIGQRFIPQINRDLISQNCPAAFSAAVIRLMDG
jgi:glycosyltransferase involved in cell wall biosynthesis